MPVNVLIVDDSDVIRSMILKTLRLADVVVGSALEASNGLEALEIIDAGGVDVVLADINMPVMDGVEMLRRLRASEEHTTLPVIMVTTEGAKERIAELEREGVSAYVRKPFTPETIRDVVGSVMDGLASGEDSAEALQIAVSEVLERFLMMDSAPAGADTPDPDASEGGLLQAAMTFRGGVTGSMTLVAPVALCREMAAAAMGVDVDEPAVDEKAPDALGEALNMTCGCLVMGREPDRSTDLTPPTIEAIGVGDWRRLREAAGTVAFIVEGHPILASCSTRPNR